MLRTYLHGLLCRAWLRIWRPRSHFAAESWKNYIRFQFWNFHLWGSCSFWVANFCINNIGSIFFLTEVVFYSTFSLILRRFSWNCTNLTLRSQFWRTLVIITIFIILLAFRAILAQFLWARFTRTILFFGTFRFKNWYKIIWFGRRFFLLAKIITGIFN